MTNSKGKRQLTYAHPKMIQMLNLPDRDFRAANLTIFHEVKEKHI